MPSKTRALRSAASYADCLELFREVPEPKAKDWYPNDRPLGTTHQRHYRVEKLNDRFHVILYDTVMAEYQVLPDGAEQRKFVWDSRHTSSMFLWDVCGVGRDSTYDTTDGRRVIVPLAEARSATLVFENGALNVARSDHGQTYTYRVCDADRLKRKEFFDSVQVYLDAALVRVCEEEPKIEPNPYDAQRGKSPYAAKYGAFTAPSARLGPDWLKIFERDPGTCISSLHTVTQAAWVFLHGKHLFLQIEGRPTKPPTPEALEKYMHKALVRAAGLEKGTERVPQPKFKEVK